MEQEIKTVTFGPRTLTARWEITPADTLHIFRYRYLLPWNWVRLVAYFKGKKLERELINKLSDEIRKEIDAAILNDLKVVGCEKAEEK